MPLSCNFCAPWVSVTAPRGLMPRAWSITSAKKPWRSCSALPKSGKANVTRPERHHLKGIEHPRSCFRIRLATDRRHHCGPLGAGCPDLVHMLCLKTTDGDCRQRAGRHQRSEAVEAQRLGFDGLAALVAASPLPTVAIGAR